MRQKEAQLEPFKQVWGISEAPNDISWADRIAADAAARRQVIQPGLYGGGARVVAPVAGEGADIVQDAWQEQYDRYLAGIQAEEDAVRAGYSPVLEGLQDEVGDLRRAAAALGMPFDEYMATRKGIGAGVGEAADITGSVVPEINGIYDDAEAEMKKVYDQVNLNLGPQVTEALVHRVSEFEKTMEDVARTDEDAIDLLHERSGDYAKAAAQAAYSNDMYAALDAETKINAQLDFKIKETQEEIARQKKAMAAAIQAAQDRFAASFEFGEPTFEQVRDETWNEYFESNGVPEHERALAKQLFAGLAENPANMLNESTFRKGLTQHLNYQILGQLGITQDRLDAAANAGTDAKLNNILNSSDLARAFQTGQTASFKAALDLAGMGDISNGIIRKGSQNADSFIGMSSAEAKHIRNMYTSNNDISKNWDTYRSNFGPKINEGDLQQAPNGYVFPVVGNTSYSNSFGYKRSAKQRAAGKMATHQGIDIMAKRGSPIVSPVDGTVVSIDYSSVGGRYVKIRDGKGNVHYFAHMNSQSKNISAGSKVRAGTVIGQVGNTGNARDTSPHLHYGVTSRNGTKVNPYPWLRATGA
jgi:murein DD-endopeptidase MepM/ murein hydrolase activator NlpD